MTYTTRTSFATSPSSCLASPASACPDFTTSSDSVDDEKTAMPWKDYFLVKLGPWLPDLKRSVASESFSRIDTIDGTFSAKSSITSWQDKFVFPNKNFFGTSHWSYWLYLAQYLYMSTFVNRLVRKSPQNSTWMCLTIKPFTRTLYAMKVFTRDLLSISAYKKDEVTMSGSVTSVCNVKWHVTGFWPEPIGEEPHSENQ